METKSFSLPSVFKSKTVVGMLIVLIFATIMAFFGKLTPELVEVMQWVSAGFMSSRTAANIFENLGKKQ